MIRASLTQIAHWLDVACPKTDVLVAGVSTDTRTLTAGNLFVALQGPNFDGHDYLGQARDRGAVAALVSRVQEDIDLPQIRVTDTLKALQHLASAWREAVDPLVFAITGSAGKTTVKQLLAAICRADGPTLATQGNLNNDIGVPLTLLALDASDRYAVIEMGANHLGEIAQLVTIARPDLALITMAGRAHLGEFGSVENIIRAKGEIYRGLSAGSQAVINLDSAGAEDWIRECPVPWAGFALAGGGHEAEATWIGAPTDTDGLSIGERGEALIADQPLPLPGEHNRTNLLAAVALARQAGLSVETIRQGLAAFEAPKGRMQVARLADDCIVIDDSYNANPESMRAAMAYLARRDGRRVAVLGDMGELGDEGVSLHRELRDVARDLKLDAVLTLGELAASAADRAEHAYSDVDDVVTGLEKELMAARTTRQPLSILIKGSRFMRMERVLAGLSDRLAIETPAAAASEDGGAV